MKQAQIDSGHWHANYYQRGRQMNRFATALLQIARVIALVCVFIVALAVTPQAAYAAMPPLQFTAQVLQTTSPVKTIQVSGSGSSTIGISGDFNQTSRCTGGTRSWICEITVAFRPNAVGSRVGTLAVGDMRIDLIGYGLDPVLAIQTVADYQLIIAPYIASRAHLDAMRYVAEHSTLEPFLQELRAGRDRTLYQQFDTNLTRVREASACVVQAAESGSIPNACTTILNQSVAVEMLKLQERMSKYNQAQQMATNVMQKLNEAAGNIIKNLNGECPTSEC
jgi:hypothetical protein